MKNLKTIRKEKGLTKKQLAEKAQVSEKTIHRYETADDEELLYGNSYSMVSIAKALNVSLDSLVFSDVSKRDNIKEKLSLNLGGEIFIRQDYPSDDETYYWIYEFRIHDKRSITGGATMFAGWKDDSQETELRVLRPVQPVEFISILREVYGHTPLIINTTEEVMLFLKYGGHALVKEDICKGLLKRFYGPFEHKPVEYSERTVLTKDDIRNSTNLDVNKTYVYEP